MAIAMVAKALAHLLARLAQLGFYPDPEGHAICSLSYKGISVDIMPSDDGPIGFEDLWTRKALNEEIRILSAPVYLASKFEAFTNRGGDYRTSHDFEDIIFVLDNRSIIVENKYMEELLSAHLDPHSIEEP
ncbi:MAG: hypothetical protein PF450_03490 [Bacteroidales bacterium]|jgi:hypothetical protein|nr:hypothetical protein [Bacteroidales bacterium]